MLLIGFAGAFRRSELVGIEVIGRAFGKGGVTVTLRTKTDQEAPGARIGIPYGKRLETCPMCAFQDWLEAV